MITAADLVLTAFTEVVGTAPPRGLDTTPDDVAAWDSLRHVHLVNAVESRLGVALPVEVLIARGRLGDLADAVAAAR